MKVMAFNGSPRKEWNTGTLLIKALEGAASQGAETKLIYLYDLNYKGCRSCFACKTRDGKSYGRCAAKDDLLPVLRKIEESDAIILGSPIYFGSISGEMKSFMERLIFQYMTYTDPIQSLAPKRIKTRYIYTMNANEDVMKLLDWDKYLSWNEMSMKLVFGDSESLYSFNTYQFPDYSKVVADRFDPEKKAEIRREVFPLDCQKAFDMGSRLVKGE